MPPPSVRPATPVVETMPSGHRQPERMGGMVDVALRAAGLDAHRAVSGSTRTPFIMRQVDDQPIVATAQPGPVMAAAAHREEQAVVAREVHCRDDIGHVRAARDHAWPLVDHAVVEFAGLHVARIASSNQVATQALLQGLSLSRIPLCPPSYFGSLAVLPYVVILCYVNAQTWRVVARSSGNACGVDASS